MKRGKRLPSGFWPYLLISICFSNVLQAQMYDIRSYNSISGLNQSYVYAIDQDCKGYLWIGTAQGLVRYNGYSFVTLTKNDSLADDFITSIARDGEKMWLGHMNGELSFYNGHSFKAVRPKMPDKSPVTQFAHNTDGTIWAATNNGHLIQLNASRKIARILKSPAESINALVFFDSITLIAGSNDGLFVIKFNEARKIASMQKIEEIPPARITGVKKMRSGAGLYVATENEGIFVVKIVSGITNVSRVKGEPISGLQSIHEDRQGSLWLATFGSGLIRIDHPDAAKLNWTYFNKANGFITDNVKSVFEDVDGMIWCGNYGNGISRLQKRNFSRIDLKAANPENIQVISENKQFMWIAATSGLYKLTTDGKSLVEHIHFKKFPGQITALYPEGMEKLWIGTNQGLYIMDAKTKKISRYQIGTGNLENSITCITSYEGNIWIGTDKGLCKASPSGIKSWFTIGSSGLPHNAINSLYVDLSGRMWISTHCNILAYIQNNRIHKISLNLDPRLMWISSVTEAPDSSIWVATMGNGILRIKNSNVTKLDSKQGLLSDFCHGIVSDKHGNIWITHKEGISKVRIKDVFIKAYSNPGKTNNLYIIRPNAVCRDYANNLWFGTSQGLLWYENDAPATLGQKPVVDITSMIVNGNTVRAQNPFVLKPGRYKIVTEYIAVSLNEPDAVKYEVMLDGYDTQYAQTRKRSVSYNLTEGKYKLMIQAVTGSGLRSATPAEMAIIIRRPVWQYWWFFPILGISLILFIFLQFKGRERRLTYEKRNLEEKVHERTKEIELQKNEIECQRDLIRSKNKEITSSIRYAEKIQTAVLPPRELIYSIFPDYMLFMKPKDIVSGDFYWITEKKDKIIFTVADCTGHGVPGAFMSMLAMTMLKEIINAKDPLSTDQIVNRLHTMVNHSLNESKMEGLDLSLCIYDKKNKKMQFTGAMNHLVYIRNNKLEVLHADHYSVNSMREDFQPFSMTEIDVQTGDTFYLFSDGYMDQFGGNHDKKFSSRQFYNLLAEIHQMPMIQQEEAINERLKSWMKDTEQTDDITVLGIRINE